ncbi:MAG: hypothetical protein K0S93_1406 [Nitrososphaeraceae archaeon]|jgi:hypothetical protein|nr:hypothetical protein [Nitrososphaeraceae archaeon]
MTIQLPYYLKLYSTDKTTVFNQIHFFVSGDSFKDIVDQVDRFVADYVQYMRKTHGEFSRFEYGTSEGLKTKAEFEYNIPK